jgi:ribonuclease HI
MQCELATNLGYSSTGRNVKIVLLDSRGPNVSEVRRFAKHYLQYLSCFAVKKFDIQADAEAFAAGHEPPPSVASTAASKYYGVAKGRVPGVYTEWTAAQEQIKGWKQPKYKEFATRGEAEAFVRSGGKGNTPDVSKDTEESNGAESQSEDFEDDNSEEGRPKKSRKSSPNQNAGGAVVNGKDSKGGKERSQKHSSGTSTLTASIRSKPSGQTVPLIVHTDGSSRGNGKIGAVAGVGVYFGEGDPR